MLRQFGREVGDAVIENLGRAVGRVQERTPLPVDLLESDDAYLAVFDAPGAAAGDVRVQYVDDRVEVRIDRFRDFREPFDMRYPGRGLSLEGSVTVPDDARLAPEAATATLREDGTLHVRVPKREATAPVDETVEEVDEREDAGEEVDEAHGEDDGNDETGATDDERESSGVDDEIHEHTEALDEGPDDATTEGWGGEVDDDVDPSDDEYS